MTMGRHEFMEHEMEWNGMKWNGSSWICMRIPYSCTWWQWWCFWRDLPEQLYLKCYGCSREFARKVDGSSLPAPHELVVQFV